jgi:maltose/moltooligosaccharide transporter
MDNYKGVKPRLSFWQLFNMSFGFLGIQFGFELQNSNMSRIFETLGANKDEIPILWIAAPLTGLLVQPIIGYLSDRTWHPFWGRRRPYFFIGAILSTLALFAMPNCSALWVAGSLLWLLDASINISMEPFRAFVGDKLPNEQRTAGFAMQTFFIGVGSVVAALLPQLFQNIFKTTAGAGEIPENVKWSFYIGGIAFLVAVFYTVFTTKEFPPESIEKLKAENAQTGFWQGIVESFKGIFTMPKTMRQLAVVQFFTWFALFAMWIYSTNAVTSNLYNMKVNSTTFNQMNTQLQDTLTITKDVKKIKSLKALQQDIIDINKFEADAPLKNITINMANYFYDHPNTYLVADTANIAKVKANYNKGANWLSTCSSVRNATAALFAFLLPVIARSIGRKKTHFVCLLLGGLGLILPKFISDPNYLLLSMFLMGIAWASILTMPYAILSGSLPGNRMGYYMGVFNFFIVIPQILAASILGWFTMHVFGGNTLTTVAFGGCSLLLAAILALFVHDNEAH